MAKETREIPAVAERLLSNDSVARSIAQRVALDQTRVAVICGRGSSGHAGVHLRYLIETRLGIPVSVTAPSILTVLKSPLKLQDQLFIVISQSGGSPDLTAATLAARDAGARTIALVNAAHSPLADAAECVFPLLAGPETSVAATKSVIASMIAGSMLVAEWAQDNALRQALWRMPDRLSRALDCDWSEAVPAFTKASCAFVTGRGFGLSTARESALKLAETLRMPALGYSAAELLHGPRAAVSAATPVIAYRLADQTGPDVDRLVQHLEGDRIPVFTAGGMDNNLPWIGDDHAVTDAITMLAPTYALIESIAHRKGYDPDRPPHLSKVTSTF